MSTSTSSSDTAQRREGKAPAADPQEEPVVETIATAAADLQGEPVVETTATAAAAANKVTTTTTRKEVTTTTTKNNNNKKKKDASATRTMTPQQIDALLRYKPTYFREDAIPKVSKERLAHANLADKGDLPVPLDKMDAYIAGIFRRVNAMEEGFMREREQILNEHHARAYMEEVAAPPPAGRRRFRPGVSKQASGKNNKLN